jgi:hypothetical protein
MWDSAVLGCVDLKNFMKNNTQIQSESEKFDGVMRQILSVSKEEQKKNIYFSGLNSMHW